MPAPRVERRLTARCRQCHREFTYGSHLPTQVICPECYYETRGDLTGAVWEAVWRAGYEQGQAQVLAQRDDLAEATAKIRELLPFRDILALCHPDVHPEERRERATRTTALILDLRAALEAAA